MKALAAWFHDERRFLAAVIGFGLLLRLALVLKTGAGGLSPDSGDWMRIAMSVASGDGFGGTWRPPGYAAFLAAIFFVFGKSVIAAKLANVALGGATMYLAYRIALALFDRTTARVTLVMTSFYPYLLAYTADVLSETLLTFMIAASVLALVMAAEKPIMRRLAPAGLICGLTALTKSVVLPFFLLAGVWLWVRTRRISAPLLVALFGALTLAPWSLRNYFHYDSSYVMPVNTPWYSLYGSTCDEALADASKGEITKGAGVPEYNQFLPADWEAVGAMPIPERDKYCKKKVKAWISANPGKYARLLALRLKHFWRLYPIIAYGWQKAAAMATSGIYIPLALVGIFLARPFIGRASLLLALFAAHTLVHLFFAVTLRYRVPIDPYVMMFAAFAMTEGARRLRRPKEN